MKWTVVEPCFYKDRITANGNKFIIGNGYMGYRGTLEEYTRDELVACNLAGLYDKVRDMWREPVNAPNGLYTKLYCDGVPLSVLSCEVEGHKQTLDIRNAVHKRETVFKTPEGNAVSISAERFISMENLHTIHMKYVFRPEKDCNILIETGIDGSIWDINGPHLEEFSCNVCNGVLVMSAMTHEQKQPVVVTEETDISFGNEEIKKSADSILRNIRVDCKAGKEYEFVKHIAVFTGIDNVDNPVGEAVRICKKSKHEGYKSLLNKHELLWEKKWESCDVEINGDNEAQSALRYSIYHLLIIAPSHTDKSSITARGLSGQVYKGAIFWDTEMFMLPFFIYTNPALARNIMMYRVNTLEGAKRKAAEYGYRGAFYPWESQDTGDDACTLFNVTDVFTGRPLRTYFRDKQIHISADVAYGIWQYYSLTGDESILLDGGAEVVVECARFFYSYSYFKADKCRFELLDVTGPDEYHERVNNNAFTNSMVKHTLQIAMKVLELLKDKYNDRYVELVTKDGFDEDIKGIEKMDELLYIPEPDCQTAIIEQFDGYHTLEDPKLSELKARVINKNEYLGGGNGLAATTKILKQADVVLMLNHFKNSYSRDIKKANWEYYEPRTEHGSSLSPCVYAMVAADVGYSEWAYKYFIKTATIDLTGDSKQFVGDLYIGGTHPAANGGAWMAAVLGFAGVNGDEDAIRVNPALPQKWKSIRFKMYIKGQKFHVSVYRDEICICSDSGNLMEQQFILAGNTVTCKPGQEIKLKF